MTEKSQVRENFFSGPNDSPEPPPKYSVFAINSESPTFDRSILKNYDPIIQKRRYRRIAR